MQSHKITLRTGNRTIQWIGFVLGLLIAPTLARAGEPRISAHVDRNTISKDDTVSFKISVKSDSNTMVGEPQFHAPDFEVVNEFNAISVSSQYDSQLGRFLMLNHQQITKVMRPLRIGTLKIADIRINAGGKIYKADDITVTVRNASSGGSGRGIPSTRDEDENFQSQRPSQRHPGRPVPRVNPNAANHTFVRAELSKHSVYKGEQIIISYYLYRQVKVFNIQVEKFPVLNGFLREDLDIPVMSQRLDTEQVELNGELYERSLLAKYAAYPLESGKLSIDSMSLRYNYYSGRSGGLDEDDPFFGFFQQMAPRTGSAKSDQLMIDVQPLPEQGRPQNFSGGIGDFNVVSAVDKYEVRANDAITLTIKVDGNGNISNIQEPKANWPENIELYDTKGRTQNGRGGGGTKLFEFLLIPRQPGKLDLPSLEFGFFDPIKKQYYTKSTEPIQIQVLDPAPGTQLAPTARSTPPKSVESSIPSEKPKGAGNVLRYLKTPNELSANQSWLPNWRYLYWGFFAVLGIFMALVGYDTVQRRKGRGQTLKSQGSLKVWDSIQNAADAASQGGSWQDVCHIYEQLTDELLDVLDRKYAISSRSLSRVHLKQVLVDEKGLAHPVWVRLVKLLEYADLVRFASTAGAATETQARAELTKSVLEGRALSQELTQETS